MSGLYYLLPNHKCPYHDHDHDEEDEEEECEEEAEETVGKLDMASIRSKLGDGHHHHHHHHHKRKKRAMSLVEQRSKFFGPGGQVKVEEEGTVPDSVKAIREALSKSQALPPWRRTSLQLDLGLPPAPAPTPSPPPSGSDTGCGESMTSEDTVREAASVCSDYESVDLDLLVADCSPAPQSPALHSALPLPPPPDPQSCDVTEVTAALQRCEVTPAAEFRQAPEELKDGEEVRLDHRTEAEYKDGLATLSLERLEPEDAALYTCHAANSLGASQTQASLAVEEVRHRRKRKEDVETKATVKVPREEPEAAVPPEFTLPLVDQVKRAGDEVEFSVTVHGKPMPEVTWYQGKDPIVTSLRHHIEGGRGVHRLRVTRLSAHDAGEYSCVASNTHGSATTSCDLKVIERVPEGQTRPRFVLPLENMTVTEGSVVRLEVKVRGNPAPKIEWYKDRQRLEADRHFLMEEEEEVRALVIHEVSQRDAGFFLCRAINPAGSDSTEARIRVQRLPEETEEEYHVDTSTLAAAPLLTYNIRVPPDFTAKLRDKRYFEGASLRLTCSVTGIPAPSVQWFHNDHQIFDDHHYTISNNRGLLTLDIGFVSLADSGSYSCVAENSEGVAECECKVTIEAEPEAEVFEYDVARPKFVRPLQDQTVTLGADAVFECQAIGKPMPAFKWQKDLIGLTQSRRLTTEYDAEGHARLVLRNVQHSDAGLYTCLAHGSSGRTKCTATLRVRDEAGSPPRDTRGRSASVLSDLGERGEKPRFTMTLPEELELFVGQRLRLDGTVEGRPKAVVTWHKGVRELSYGQRHRIVMLGQMHALEIPAVMSTDAGLYILRATNIYGTSECTCRVTVKSGRPERGGDVSAVSPVSKRRQLAMQMREGEELPPIPQAPFFIKHLPPTIEVMAGMDVQLDCIVNSSGEMITWDPKARDQAAQRLAAQGFRGDFVPMATRPAQEEVLGLPAMEREEPQQRKPKEAAEPPYFRSKPRDVTVPPGGEAVFTAVVGGSPTPSVTWTKRGRPLVSSDCLRLVAEGDQHQLRVVNVAKGDEGEYVCTATSASGTASAAASLALQAKPDTEAASAATKTEDSAKPEKDSKKMDSTSEGAPTFTLPLQDMKAKDGDQVLLECKVKGDPRPQIAWYRDGKEILDSSDFQLSMIGDVCKLLIQEIFPEDEGRYSCRAYNDQGEATTECLLAVEGGSGRTRPGQDGDSKQVEFKVDTKKGKLLVEKEVPPEFVVKPRRQFVDEGQTAKFKASFEGSSSTVLTWLKDGQKVQQDATHKMYTKDDFYFLEITEVAAGDAGNYTCRIENSAGSSSAIAELEVFEHPKLVSKGKQAPPPSLVSPLLDMQVHAGDRQVRLECTVQDALDCQVTWYRDERELAPSSHQRAMFDGSTATLVLREVEEEDGGRYRARLSNSLGQVETACTLNVQPRLEPPRFVRELHDMEVDDGDKVELTVEVKDELSNGGSSTSSA